MKTCFSIMPFEGFDDIDRIIGEAARECGLDYVRGDRRHRPGNILPQILRDIRDAVVVVADVTGHNPNVYYELGIAHQLKRPERVVIITQSSKDIPYDVHEFRQLVYQQSEAGRADLRQQLPVYVRAALQTRDDQEIWNVIRGRLPRTRLLVRDLQQLIETAGTKGLAGVRIRVVAGLSSLAISDHEPPDPDDGVEYKTALLSERNTLRDALLRGAELKALLHPPRRFAQQRLIPVRLRVRYERLLGLLDGRSDIEHDAKAAEEDVAAMEQCEFLLTPVPTPNLFIIGDRVAYEGMKRAGKPGFEMTHCATNPEDLRELIDQFDRLFDETRHEMQRTHPPDGRVGQQLRMFYTEAISALESEHTPSGE